MLHTISKTVGYFSILGSLDLDDTLQPTISKFMDLDNRLKSSSVTHILHFVKYINDSQAYQEHRIINDRIM